MIVSFRHKGLQRLFEAADRSGVRGDQVQRLRRILARLDVASDIDHMALPGYRLHPLKGDLAGQWSVTVSANWRLIFRFRDGNAFDVQLVDYH